jgi:hypothetical protein
MQGDRVSSRGRRAIPQKNQQTSPRQRGTHRGRRTWIVAAAAILIAVVVAGELLLRHFTGPQYVENQLARKFGPGYRVEIGSSHYDLLTRTFSLANVSIVSDTLRVQHHGHDHPKKFTSLNVPSLRASGVSLPALQRGDIIMDRVVIDQPTCTLYVDRKGVPLVHPRPAVSLPQEVLLASPRRIRIGTIYVVNGDIRYAERAHDGTRPGMFRFADLNVTIDNLTNDKMPLKQPCIIDARTRLADSGPLHAVFKYDLCSRELRMDYNAVIGTMDGLSLNDLLVDLSGIRIKRGTIDPPR